jgi:hypothetical protein
MTIAIGNRDAADTAEATADPASAADTAPAATQPLRGISER